VNGQSVGDIFKLDGTIYKYEVPVSVGDVYQVVVDNKAGHYNFLFWEADDNHISGNFYLRRAPSYLITLTVTGGILLVVGSALIPSAVLLKYETRRQAKLVYECPRCRKQVRIGLSNCPYCKIDITKYWIKCSYCGRLFDSHLGKCPKCGAEAGG
jgi:RNA polymerase subunit RPABC4/transcription elongation factor Spt4